MNPFIAILTTSLTLFAPHAFAEPPEFLIPVTDSAKAIAQANNEYFLKKETYFAKQYRIVKVNTDLLLKAERIKISLFNDQSVVLQVSSVDVHPEGFEIVWRGRFIEPAGVSIDELVAGGMSREAAEQLAPQLNSLTIGAAQARLKYGYHFSRFEEFLDASRKFSLDGQSPIYEVGFYITGDLFASVTKPPAPPVDTTIRILLIADNRLTSQQITLAKAFLTESWNNTTFNTTTPTTLTFANNGLAIPAGSSVFSGDGVDQMKGSGAL